MDILRETFQTIGEAYRTPEGMAQLRLDCFLSDIKHELKVMDIDLTKDHLKAAEYSLNRFKEELKDILVENEVLKLKVK